VARLEPFRPTVYDPSKVVADDVIAPPYDVVSPPERASLAARSPYNAIHVELPAASPGSPVGPFEAAADLFRAWHDEGVVAVLDKASFVLYRMTFRSEDGAVRSTTGVLGALGIGPDQKGEVLPHEETTPKDKFDRLELLRATRTNVSPIWTLSLAEGLSKACDEAITRAGQPWSASDDDGVLHERWIVDDAATLESLSELVASTPVLVADGHHRYETACNFLEDSPDLPGADAVLAFAVELSPDELVVQAIHRLVPGVDSVGFAKDLERWFEVSPGPEDEAALAEAMDEVGALGLVTTAGTWLLKPRELLSAEVEDDLDSSRFEVAVRGLGLTAITYQHGIARAKKEVYAGMADAAVLLRPASVEQIARTAHGGRRMPPKTTFFAPKLRTGMAFRELDPPG
jgi:uncharacterized protein (DUF1015 family)